MNDRIERWLVEMGDPGVARRVDRDIGGGGHGRPSYRVPSDLRIDPRRDLVRTLIGHRQFCALCQFVVMFPMFLAFLDWFVPSFTP